MLLKIFVLYGSGIKNLAKVCGMTEDEMARKIAQFKRELPALSTLIINCGASAEKHGYLQAIDGRWGRIRKSGGKLLIHTVLNVLLQMTGSLSMKYARCMASNQMLKEGVGLDGNGYVAFLADVHDEHQMEVNESEVELMVYTVEGKAGWKVDEKRQHIDSEGQIWSAPEVTEKTSDTEWIIERKFHRAGHILANNHKLAGEFLRMRIPLQGEYKIGKSWHDTH
jgi:DNA polymerase I-like protein with 3'-5' exonuclease and polymerase domains